MRPQTIELPPLTKGAQIQPTRRERRVSAHLQLKIMGADRWGTAFQGPATTLDVSGVGARMTLPGHSLKTGSIIQVQYGNRSCRCQVVWVGKPGGADQDEVGVRCLDEVECPWAELVDLQTPPSQQAQGGQVQSNQVQSNPVQSQQATATPSEEATAAGEPAASEPAWPDSERRRAQRYHCDLILQVKTGADSIPVSLKVTDISLRGCYVETMSPLPVGAQMELTLFLQGIKVPMGGVVRTSHASMGNGIEFVRMSPEAVQRLEQFFAKIGGPAESQSPAAENASRSAGARERPEFTLSVGAQMEALMELLERRAILTRNEVLQLALENAARKLDR